MNKKRLTAFILIFVGILGALANTPKKVFANSSTWQKGANINPESSTDFGSAAFDQSLAKLKDINANYVYLVIPLSQSSLTSSDISAAWNTPTDASLIHAIQTAHKLGLAVALKPHVDPINGEWRANINPTSRTSWFANYGKIIDHYASIAQTNGVEEIVLGTELIDLSSSTMDASNTQFWNNLIAKTRTEFTGKLTYAANWGTGWGDEKNQIDFWNNLDFAGIDAYYTLGSDYSNNSAENLVNYWAQWDKWDVSVFQKKINKPIVFTEVGYRSTSGAHVYPWDYSMNNGVNQTEQANAYQALFSYWNNIPFFNGVAFWEWKTNPNAGGASDANFTPQNKSAQSVISQWFGDQGTTSTPISQNLVKLSASATVPISLPVGQSSTIGFNVINSGSAQSSLIYDFEIYNSQNQQIFQKSFDNQTLGANQSSNFQIPWTPQTAGNYTVKLGIFNNNWSVNYYWNDNANTFGVSTPVVINPPVIVPTPPVNTTSSSCPTTIPENTFSTCFYNGTDLNSFILSRNDNSINFDWGGGSPDQKIPSDNFSAVWQGSFDFSGSNSANDYKFNLTVDDGAMLFIDNQMVLNEWRDQVASFNITKSLTSGKHTIKLQYYERGGGAKVNLSWTKVESSAPQIPVVQPDPTPTNPPVVTTPPTSNPPTTTTTTPVSSIIDVWWPTTNSTISGSLPFKSLLENSGLDFYDMYWQVDGDSLNLMSNSQQDYPHKESLVDVSGWNWKGTGPYTLTFVAKDKTGKILGTKDLQVTIQH